MYCFCILHKVIDSFISLNALFDFRLQTKPLVPTYNVQRVCYHIKYRCLNIVQGQLSNYYLGYLGVNDCVYCIAIV